jgi:hypothetical protein
MWISVLVESCDEAWLQNTPILAPSMWTIAASLQDMKEQYPWYSSTSSGGSGRVSIILHRDLCETNLRQMCVFYLARCCPLLAVVNEHTDSLVTESLLHTLKGEYIILQNVTPCLEWKGIVLLLDGKQVMFWGFEHMYIITWQHWMIIAARSSSLGQGSHTFG